MGGCQSGAESQAFVAVQRVALHDSSIQSAVVCSVTRGLSVDGHGAACINRRLLLGAGSPQQRDAIAEEITTTGKAMARAIAQNLNLTCVGVEFNVLDTVSYDKALLCQIKLWTA